MSLAQSLEKRSQISTGVLIQQYYNQLHDLQSVSGTNRETVMREAFKDLLKGCARSHDLIFVPEYEIATCQGRRYVDGALLHRLRAPFGHWEAKRDKDNLDAEIEHKLERGYPQDNIIFEDSRLAVLIQDSKETLRTKVEDKRNLENLLNRFFEHQQKAYIEFRKAIDQFKADLPAVLKTLRMMIEGAEIQNKLFREAAGTFLVLAKKAINPTLGAADVREMLIQHILTEELFAAVFPDTSFHRDNNIARELYKLESTFFIGNTKYSTLKAMGPYYASIRANAAQISSHHEKQAFLKVLYENFYKVYNPKAAARLGVVYTPNEIVRFMVESTDWLCEKYFERNLIDRNVEILDPATGTGTFICELLEHFRGRPADLAHKYREELFANEVAILPYYVANLNIEATYAGLAREYVEFPNLCFVDTLDNVGLHTAKRGTQGELFGSISDENVKRIKHQNSRRISVIIGNPPYYAGQANENDNNKSRAYLHIDKRISETYIAESGAQKTKAYDMYTRFYRWASDRLERNGILAFITNRSFIDSSTLDGFRKTVANEFNEIYVFDLGGGVIDNPKLSGPKHNVFGIKTGVAITFMIRRAGGKGCRIYYARRPEFETAEDKRALLNSVKISSLGFSQIRPDANGNWINLANKDEEEAFDSLMPLISKEVKATNKPRQMKALFHLFACGIKTNRDEWLYDFDPVALMGKVEFLTTKLLSGGQGYDPSIKWSRDLKLKVARGLTSQDTAGTILQSLWRPFVKKQYWANKVTSDILTEFHYRIYGKDLSHANPSILISVGKRGQGAAIATQIPPNYDMFVPDVGQIVSRWQRDKTGARVDNITDWGLNKFIARYKQEKPKTKRRITKDAIFNYVYAVLQDPNYRRKYAISLKRDFPGIPFYEDFWQWADWGERLLALHIGYEAAAPFPLKRIETPKTKRSPKVTLKGDKVGGRIVIDSQTELVGVPTEAWEYRVGSRSALEWILDQYKEKNPKDPTIQEKFNGYRFADYKEQVIDLLARVTTVSIETHKIISAMRMVSSRKPDCSEP